MALLLLFSGVSAAAAPQLAVDAVDHDAGIVLAGTLVTHTFILTNAGDETLTITRVSAACGCTTTAFATPKDLAPGESAELTAKIQPGSAAVSTSKTVTVTSNDGGIPGSSVTLRIRYTVRPIGQYGMGGAAFRDDFYVLIDLRDPEAFAAGHVLGAINLPYSDMDSWSTLLPTGVPLFLYDQDGSVSPQAVAALREGSGSPGYPEAIGLAGGLDQWLWVFQDGDRVTSAPLDPPGTPPTWTASSSTYSIVDFRSRYFRLVIDLRTAELFEENHILGALNRPFAERERWLPDLPTDVELVFYDWDGTLSDRLVQEALDLGLLRAYSLAGGLADWFVQYNESYRMSIGLPYEPAS
jgi:rhodanese-related sulfurtransferase